MEHTFTDSNFSQEVLGAGEAVLVDFWAPWCGPCQMMGPVVESLAHEMEGKKVKIGKLNVDDNPAMAQQYNVMSIPTFLVFKEGKVVDQMVGGVPKEKLQAFLEKHI